MRCARPCRRPSPSAACRMRSATSSGGGPSAVGSRDPPPRRRSLAGLTPPLWDQRRVRYRAARDVAEGRRLVLEAVDARDGLLASAATPPRFVEVRRFTTLPARYAAWAAANGLPRPPPASPLDAPARLAREAPPPHLRILAPRSGLQLVRDPESPASMTTLALRAIVEPPAEQIVWYVDGAPFQVV